MIVCSFNRQSLLGNEQRFKFKKDLPWSPLSPLSPSRPSLPGTPLCPGSPGMPGCPQTQPLVCVCSCATHLAIQSRSSRQRIYLICNITIIVQKMKVWANVALRVKPCSILNGWEKNCERGSQDSKPNCTGTLDKRGLETLSLAWLITYWAVSYTSPVPLQNS